MIRKLFLVITLLSSIWAYTAIGTTNITFADTLLAKTVGEIYDYPVIILGRNVLNAVAERMLRTLNITDVVIIGGPYVVSPAVEEELIREGYNVTRLWGVTRYETSAVVAKFFWNSSKEAIILTSELTRENARAKEFSFVSKAVDLAVEKKIPILYTPTGYLDINVADALQTLGVKTVYLYTLSKNISNLEKDLEDLNITVIVNPNVTLTNCTKINIYANATWRSIIGFLFSGKCVEFVPKTKGPLANFSWIKIENRFKNMIRKQKENIFRLLQRKRLELIEELKKDLILLETLYNKTNDKKVLEIINKINLTLSTSNVSLNKLLNLTSQIKMIKWKLKLYMYEKRILQNRFREIMRKLEMEKKKIQERFKHYLMALNKTKEEIKEKMERVIKNLTNITEIKNAIPCLHTQRGKRVICTQEYRPVCGIMPDGSVRVFGNPCIACASGAVAYYPCNIAKARLVNVSIS